MQYLEDIILPCDDCKGKKIRPVYAEISDGVMTVSEAFSKPLSEVLSRIDLTPKFKRTWEYLKILNLDYLSLDRPLNTLSGGEKQRLYLLSKLLKSIEDTLVIFENLSFGLSDREIYQLGKFLGDLSLRGNTLIVIDSEPLFGKLAQFEIHFTSDDIQTRRLS
jgi:excinuclease ABC subunit A